MRWKYVDLDAGQIRVYQIKRKRYRHCCLGPHACGVGQYRTPCVYERRKKRCPKPCQKDCTFYPQHCPQWLGGDCFFTVPKGGGIRSVAIPKPLIPLLEEARELQRKEKLIARGRVGGMGFVLSEHARPAVGTSRRLV
jgi:integrase